MNDNLICPRCGKKLKAGYIFCIYCGMKLPSNQSVFNGYGTDDSETVPVFNGYGTDDSETVPVFNGYGTDDSETVPVFNGYGTDDSETVPVSNDYGTDDAETVPVFNGYGTDDTETVPVRQVQETVHTQGNSNHKERLGGGMNGMNTMGGMNSVNGMNTMGGMNRMNTMGGMNAMNGMNTMGGMNAMNGMNTMGGMNGLNGVNTMGGMNGMNQMNTVGGMNAMNGMNTMGGMNGLNGMNTMGSTNGVNGTGKKKSKAPVIIAIVGGVIVFVVLVLIIVILLLGDRETDRYEEETKIIEETETEESIETETDAGVAALEEISSRFLMAEDWGTQAEILPEYCGVLEEYGTDDTYVTLIQKDYFSYLDNLYAFVDNMLAADPMPAIYGEIAMDLQYAIEIGEKLENLDVTCNPQEIQEKLSSIKDDYTERICERFDATAENEIETNGQISRSELWKIMEGADSCGLYGGEEEDNPVCARYVAALTFHVDSEFASMSGDDGMKYLYENLEATQYSPLLLYYLVYVYGDNNAESMYEEACNILMEQCNIDFDNMGDAEKKNFIYEMSHSDYDEVRKEIRNRMKDVFMNPYE